MKNYKDPPPTPQILSDSEISFQKCYSTKSKETIKDADGHKESEKSFSFTKASLFKENTDWHQQGICLTEWDLPCANTALDGVNPNCLHNKLSLFWGSRFIKIYRAYFPALKITVGEWRALISENGWAKPGHFHFSYTALAAYMHVPAPTGWPMGDWG